MADGNPDKPVVSEVCQVGKARQLFAAGLLASTVVGHVGYPVLLHLATRRRVDPVAPVPDEWPAVTVLVPAYLEAGVIADKIDNIAKNGYVGDVEVLVVADGDPETARVAESWGARVLLLPERLGKSQALNHGMAAASHEIVIVTDANSSLEYGSIAALVRWLGEPDVGAVAGEKHEGEGGELLYWRFESWLKRREFRLGTTLGLDGGLCAIRRSAWQDIPPDISNDDFWVALDLMDRGLRVAYEPEGLMRESSIGTLPLVWERKTRVLAGGLWVMWRKRALLSPARRAVSGQLWGHKLWRSTGGPISHVALLALAVLGVRNSRVARLFLAGHAAAAMALIAHENGGKVPELLRVGAQVLLLQAVALGGMRRFAQQDRVLQWSKPAR